MVMTAQRQPEPSPVARGHVSRSCRRRLQRQRPSIRETYVSATTAQTVPLERRLVTVQSDASMGTDALRHPNLSAETGHMPPLEPAAASDNRETHGRKAAEASAGTHARLWELAQNAAGSRELQTRLNEAADDADRQLVAESLRGHIWEAIRCPNANFVVQKLVETVRPQVLQFVIDEIFASGPRAVQRMARHNYGCRILQRLLEHCLSTQLEQVADDLLSEAVRLSVHQYGNYVMQCLASHGSQEQRQRLTRYISEDAAIVASSFHGCAVLSSLLSHETIDELLVLSCAILHIDGLVAKVGRMRHGHEVVEQLADKVARQPEKWLLLHHQLRQGLSSLSGSRYGRGVIVKFKLQEPLQGA